ELAELEKLIKSRRSIRRWQDKKVPEELLLKAIEMATWAPNGGNQQNWHFYVVVNHNTIKAMADAVQASADRMASWPEAEKFGMAAGWRERASFFRSAPAAIVVGAAQYQSPVDQVFAAREKVDSRATQMRQWRNVADSRIQSVASAIAYLLLVLHQMGLGAVWMTGPLQAKGEIEKIIKVPPGMDIVAFIPVGYPDEEPTSRGRKPVSEVTEVIR
ncbi:MAG: nitroreductase family protein, partial [Dehalococcoidales bacterium]|nr:nitroreductase family protein [Dehalococcoidales bacterium]